jgi:hypothetical protein
MTAELEAARRLGERWAIRQERLLDGLDPGTEVTDSLNEDRELLALWSAGLAVEPPADRHLEAFEEAPASALSHHAKLLLLRRQQFLSIDRPTMMRLEAIYDHAIGALRALLSSSDAGASKVAVEQLLDLERRELERFVAEIPGARQRTTCGEYSAELQLEVLGLSLDDLAQPLLDVGCGEQALLVHFLAEQGLEAFGLDRHARGARVIRADWLEFEFGANRFGTIVSHQAFSLHFLRHHLEPGDFARRYAIAYRTILGSLRKNGRFVYAPGLPFVERLLPASFVVARTPLPEALAENVRRAFAASGEDVAYASHVSRK